MKKKLFCFFPILFFFLTSVFSVNYLVVDVSGSMKGFVGGEYTRVLGELPRGLSISSVFEYQLVGVGDKIIKYESFILGKLSKDGSYYSRQESNLLKVVNLFEDKKPSFALFITDAEVDTKAGCEDFSTKLAEFVFKNNYSISIIGIKSRYKGFLSPPNHKNIKLKKPIYRPFYIFILSRDENKGEKFLNYMVRFLKRIKNEYAGNSLFSYRFLKIYPVIYPEISIELDSFPEYLCPFFRKGKIDKVNRGIIAFELYKKDKDSHGMELYYKKETDSIKFYQFLKIKIPINVKFPGGNSQLFSVSPSFYAYKKVKRKEVGISKILKSGEYRDGVLSLLFKPSLLFFTGSGEVVFNVIFRARTIDFEGINLWNDWSATSVESLEYRNGATLNISDMLNFLEEYFLEKGEKRERKIYKLSFHFNK